MMMMMMIVNMRSQKCFVLLMNDYYFAGYNQAHHLLMLSDVCANNSNKIKQGSTDRLLLTIYYILRSPNHDVVSLYLSLYLLAKILENLRKILRIYVKKIFPIRYFTARTLADQRNVNNNNKNK